MKYFYMVLAIIFIIATGISVAVIMDLKHQNGEAAKTILYIGNERDALKTKADDLAAENELLLKLSDLKAFPSRSSLENWCKENTSYNKETSYSEDAIRLMNIARKDGYYLGLVGLEMVSTQKILKIPVYPYVDYTNFYVLNIAIVGESDIYIVDPASGTSFKTAEMKGKFGWGLLPQ